MAGTAHSLNSEARDRMLIAAVWLISLGALFLVKDYFGWNWQQAWPLWVIFVGVGTAGSTIFGRSRSLFGLWGLWWPLVVIAVGVVLLLSTTGTIAIDPGQIIGWWPVLVIAIGAWFLLGALLVRPKAGVETLEVPLAGLAEAAVKINFGGGELTLGPAPAGALVAGHFDGGVRQRSKGPGQIELEPYTEAWPLWSRPLRWQVGLTSEIPVDLRLDTGANRSTIDLSSLRVRRLELHTGASETHVRLPASGTTAVRAEAGLASLTIEVPPGVAARIRSTVALGSTNVDETRFPRALDGWASPDYDGAANRVEIELAGGLGSVRVA